MGKGTGDMGPVLYGRPFIEVDAALLDSDILKDCYQKIVYIYLKALADDAGRCTPSMRILSGLTKINITRLQYTINGLVKMGLVEKEHRTYEDGGNRSNLYIVHDLSEISDTVDHLDGQNALIRIYKDFFWNDQLDNCQQKLIYLCLSRSAYVRGGCCPSIKKLSGSTKLGISKVRSTLGELEQKGLVSKEKIKVANGCRNLYILSHDYVKDLGVVHDKGIGRYLEDYSIFGLDMVGM